MALVRAVDTDPVRQAIVRDAFASLDRVEAARRTIAAALH